MQSNVEDPEVAVEVNSLPSSATISWAQSGGGYVSPFNQLSASRLP